MCYISPLDHFVRVSFLFESMSVQMINACGPVRCTFYQYPIVPVLYDYFVVLQLVRLVVRKGGRNYPSCSFCVVLCFWFFRDLCTASWYSHWKPRANRMPRLGCVHPLDSLPLLTVLNHWGNSCGRLSVIHLNWNGTFQKCERTRKNGRHLVCLSLAVDIVTAVSTTASQETAVLLPPQRTNSTGARIKRQGHGKEATVANDEKNEILGSERRYGTGDRNLAVLWRTEPKRSRNKKRTGIRG